MSFDLNLWARSQGWSMAGVSPPELGEKSAQNFEAWLQDSSAPGLSYIERRKKERLDPKLYFKGLKSILCFGLYYFPGWAKNSIKISNYAWSGDYHRRLTDKIEESMALLQRELGVFDYRIAVDTSPVLEKTLAVQAGLGWQGKNSLVLNREHGSLFFLGEAYTNLPLERFQAPRLSQNHCGSCTRCLEACPTQALTPFQLDAKKCISYWNLEHKGSFDQTTPAWSEWIAGCDICQEVCPWNQKLIPLEAASEPAFSAEEILEQDFKSWAQQSALQYVKAESWPRNLEWISKKSESES